MELLFPPFTESPLGPFVDEEDFLTVCWRSHFFYMSWERGRSEGRECPHRKNAVGTLNNLDGDLDQTYKSDISHTSSVPSY